jgi:GTP cyclohydrolase I
LLEIYARRLQIQERLGEQITLALMEHLQPLGAACIIEAQHLCMKARGVEKQNSIMVTSSMKGLFLTDQSAKQELLNLIKL